MCCGDIKALGSFSDTIKRESRNVRRFRRAYTSNLLGRVESLSLRSSGLCPRFFDKPAFKCKLNDKPVYWASRLRTERERDTLSSLSPSMMMIVLMMLMMGWMDWMDGDGLSISIGPKVILSPRRNRSHFMASQLISEVNMAALGKLSQQVLISSTFYAIN